ncbi:helix-turn-helix domain-containing protein [Mesorhizobium sp. M0220]|uniref:helix-turn-helix transcriptional regulator n=1 Tax=Mesorhizobium sp. M0220 TaxID=2956920 RepID=UPI003339D337
MNMRELRVRLGMTQKDLAEQMATTQQTVARWETGKTQLNVEQIKDLCLTLKCTVEELLGWKIDVEEWRTSPFAIADAETRYGTLRIKTTVGSRQYPIDEKARESILRQLKELHNLRRNNTSRPWLYCWSLDNKILLINPQYVRTIELIGDDVEEMPEYYHPEIYRALDDWDKGEISGKLKKECDAIIAEMGDQEAVRMASYVRVTYDDGEDEWNFLDEETATTFFGLEAATFDVPQCSFAEVEEEGYYRARYANLDRVAVMEVPSDRYHRLTAPEEA